MEDSQIRLLALYQDYLGNILTNDGCHEANDGFSVDARINTLESEGKCSPSSGKSTKRASQFDLK